MISGSETDRDIIDGLKLKLKKLEAEEKKLQDEIEQIGVEKKKILTQISEHSDANYEQNMLQLVYEQRRKK